MDLPKEDSVIWLSAALKHVRDGVIFIDPAGEIIWMNPAAEQLIEPQELRTKGRRIDAVFSSMVREPGNPIVVSVQTVLGGGPAAQASGHELFHFGSRSVRVDYTITPVMQDGECRGAVIVLSRHVPGSGPDTDGHLKESGEKPVGRQQGGVRRVLVMDDDDVVRNLTVQKLIRLGYDSEGASSGEEAIRKFQTARDLGKPFDVVVLDLIIRGGMGGKGTLEALRDVDPDVRAILTSGHAANPVLTNFWEYGFFGVIRKPFVIKELDVAIRHALEEE